jgi:N-acetyl-gamma-glutamyl-phosphate reductase
MMRTVSIVNVTSYTGLELLRLLALHPQFVVTSVTARSAVGERLGEIFPQLQAAPRVNVEDGHRTRAVDPNLVITEEPQQTDLAFVCLPHAAAAEMDIQLLQRGTKVVDLSADFRLHDVAVYEQWYKHTHPAPALLETSVYGLCERYRDTIRQTSLVANPGCHAITAILALLPAVAAGIIEPDIIIDSKSGISGAGRSLSLSTHYAEANEDVSAYNLDGHRHMPEIKQEVEAAASEGYASEEGFAITFVPHLIPMTRGILSTSYATLRKNASQRPTSTEEVRALYRQYYEGEPFVHVVDQPPHTKWTYGSNHCFIHPIIDTRTNRLIVVSCLDNLVKGAAGQALQNANLLCGLPETSALNAIGINP